MNKTDHAKLVAKLQKLQVTENELWEKLDAVVAERNDLLAGGGGIAQHMQEAREDWDAIWSARYRSPYVWTYGKDMPHLKRLLRAMGRDELSTRMTRFLGSNEPFHVNASHSFGLFVATVNAWIAKDTALFERATMNCQHVPRCKTDAQHTQTRQRELLEA